MLCTRLLPILTFLLFPILTHSLLIDVILGSGSSDATISYDSTVFVSWTAETDDPTSVTFEIRNYKTLYTWIFAAGIELSQLNMTHTLGNITESGTYSLQAVDVNNSQKIYGQSQTFTVTGPQITPAGTGSMSPQSTSESLNLQSTSIPETSALPKASRKTPIGAIIGGVVGGLVLIALLVGAFLYYRRRQRLQAETLSVVPLAFDLTYTPPSVDKRERLQEVLSEKASAHRQRDQLRTDLGARGARDTESEARLRRQVEMMSERILQLERQQREIESVYQGRTLESDLNVPPPDYSVTTFSRSSA